MKADLITRPATTTTTHTHTHNSLSTTTPCFCSQEYINTGRANAYGAHYLEISAALIELHAEVECLV